MTTPTLDDGEIDNLARHAQYIIDHPEIEVFASRKLEVDCVFLVALIAEVRRLRETDDKLQMVVEANHQLERILSSTEQYRDRALADLANAREERDAEHERAGDALASIAAFLACFPDHAVAVACAFDENGDDVPNEDVALDGLRAALARKGGG